VLLLATAILTLSVRELSAEPAADGIGENTGSQMTVEDARALVLFHNEKRAEVGVGKVVWSAEIARHAQEWADHLSETGEFKHRPRTENWAEGYGENLGVGYGNGYNVLSAAESWYQEIKDYRKGSPIPRFFRSFKAGHYTQMVWRSTTRIGAGVAIIKKGRMKGWLVVVCNYSPPGNFIGQRPY
jgi:uncharacterized protein YkwD